MSDYPSWIREIEILQSRKLSDEELKLARERWQVIADGDQDSAYHLAEAANDVTRLCHHRATLQAALKRVDAQVAASLSSHADAFADLFGHRLGRAAYDAIASQVPRSDQFWLSCAIAFLSAVGLIAMSILAAYLVLLAKLQTGDIPYPGQTDTQQVASQVGAALLATGSEEHAIWVARHLASPERIAMVEKYLADLDGHRDPYVELAATKLCLGPDQRRTYRRRSVSCTFAVTDASR